MHQDRKQRYPPLGSLVTVRCARGRYRLVLQLPTPELSSRIVGNPCVEGRTVCIGTFRNQFCLANFALNLYCTVLYCTVMYCTVLYCVSHFSRQLNFLFRYTSLMLLWFYEQLHIKVLIRYYFFIYAKLSFKYLLSLFLIKEYFPCKSFRLFSEYEIIQFSNVFCKYFSSIFIYNLRYNKKLIRAICLDWTRIWSSSQRFEKLSNRNPVIDHD